MSNLIAILLTFAVLNIIGFEHTVKAFIDEHTWFWYLLFIGAGIMDWRK